MADPATGKVLDRVADGRRRRRGPAIDAAAGAFAAGRPHRLPALGKLSAAHQLMLERRGDLAKLMTSEQGKPLRGGPQRGRLRRRLPAVVRRGGQAGLRPDDPLGPGRPALHRAAPARRGVRGDHAVELPDVDDHPEGRPGAGRRLHDRAQAGRADAAVRRRGVQGPRRGGPPAGVVNLVHHGRPGAGRRRAARPTRVVRKLTFTGSTEIGKRYGAGRAAR